MKETVLLRFGATNCSTHIYTLHAMAHRLYQPSAIYCFSYSRSILLIVLYCHTDGDGVVTFDEFVIVSKKYPNLLSGSTATTGRPS
jgi:hypothetical protein